MRTALRTVTALALTVPLIASTLPASASSTMLYREKGTFADAFFEGPTTPAGLAGNYSFASLSFHSTDLAEGWVDTFRCKEGATPWDSGKGCSYAGSYWAWGENLTAVTGKTKGSATTYSGTVDLYESSRTGDKLVAEDVPFQVTLSPTGATSKSTYTDTFTDPESGYTFKVRETREYTYANVQGDFGGVPAVDGSVGTYTVRAMERVS